MDKKKPPEKSDFKGLVVGLAVGTFSLPISVWFLLVAAGLVQVDALPTPSDRCFALAVGMLLGGVAVWLAPIGLGVILTRLSVPAGLAGKASEIVANAWTTSAALVGLSAYAGWTLLASVPAVDGRIASRAFFSAIILIIGAGSRIWLAAGSLSTQRHFGKTSLDPRTIKCAPGGEAALTLKLEKSATSVTGKLELYLDGDIPKKTVAARVSPATQIPDGWVYRVTAVVPTEPVLVGEDGGWVLTVHALGQDGGRFEDSASIELTSE